MGFTVSSRRKYIGRVFLVVAAAGLLDSAYLSWEHFLGGIPLCGPNDGCSLVLTSQYAEWFGVPTAVLGLVFYLVVVALGIGYWRSGRLLVLRLLTALTGLGFLVSLSFVYLQLSVIRAVCIYCMLSAGSATALFILSGLGLYFARGFDLGTSGQSDTVGEDVK